MKKIILPVIFLMGVVKVFGQEIWNPEKSQPPIVQRGSIASDSSYTILSPDIRSEKYIFTPALVSGSGFPKLKVVFETEKKKSEFEDFVGLLLGPASDFPDMKEISEFMRDFGLGDDALFRILKEGVGLKIPEWEMLMSLPKEIIVEKNLLTLLKKSNTSYRKVENFGSHIGFTQKGYVLFNVFGTVVLPACLYVEQRDGLLVVAIYQIRDGKATRFGAINLN